MIIKKGTTIKVLDELITLDDDKRSYNVYLNSDPVRKVKCISIEGEDIPLEIIEIVNES